MENQNTKNPNYVLAHLLFMLHNKSLVLTPTSDETFQSFIKDIPEFLPEREDPLLIPKLRKINERLVRNKKRISERLIRVARDRRVEFLHSRKLVEENSVLTDRVGELLRRLGIVRRENLLHIAERDNLARKLEEITSSKEAPTVKGHRAYRMSTGQESVITCSGSTCKVCKNPLT